MTQRLLRTLMRPSLKDLAKTALLSGLALGLAFTAAPTHEAEAKDKFIFANSSAYNTMDPQALFDVGRVAYRLNLYDGLMRWLDNPPKLNLWLAESHKISSDGKKYTFKLKDAKFHDGSPVEAKDVVYSTERILALKKGAASLFVKVLKPGTTKAVDPKTVEFNLVKPSAIFLATIPEIHIMNSDLMKKHEKGGDWSSAWVSKNDAGSGSFKLKRYDPAKGFLAERFTDHFYGWGDKYLDEIEFRTVVEINSRVLGMMKGDFHGADGYMPQDQIKRLRTSKNVNVMEQESMRIFYFIIHNARAPMNDIHFRKALSYAFDYDGFIKNILSNSVARNPVPLPNNIWGAPSGVKGYTFDLKKAAEHLAKVKKPIREITIGALAGYGQTEQAAVLLQNALAKLGVKSKIVAETWPVASGKMRNEQQMYDLLPLWKSTYYADPNNWVGEMYYSPNVGSRNNSWYKDAQVDKWIAEAIETTDRKVREANYAKAATKVMDDAAGIFVYNTKWFGPYSKKVDGVRFSPIGNAQEMRWVYFK
ncbi:MAG: ABC transporter substrate-binding protein [Alphaproteobacteria bacterium]|nr:peptide ABC transporter substrate-binding protein [Rhodospirillaceae bacterium]MDP6022550.1 ABC transporter substrate-binding protein [Alphaproteobacteria bacterium]MDP6256733.1 ABC transporter substrate-binding protein [Alphaproteobacteria bacterium]